MQRGCYYKRLSLHALNAPGGYRSLLPYAECLQEWSVEPANFGAGYAGIGASVAQNAKYMPPW